MALIMGAAVPIMASPDPRFSPTWDYYDHVAGEPVTTTLVAPHCLPRQLRTGQMPVWATCGQVPHYSPWAGDHLQPPQ